MNASVEVLYFSLFREITGQERESFSLGEEATTLGGLVDRIFDAHPGLREWEGKMLLAVNREFADRSTPVAGGDEVAMMPPVQGG